MFLLPSLLLGLVVTLAVGGRPSRLLEVQLRLGRLVVAALAIQLVLFSAAGEGLPSTLTGGLHAASYLLLAAFAVANLRVRGLALAFLGIALNGVAIIANGGRMPVSHDAARAAGIELAGHSNVSSDADRLSFLGDVFALPHELPLANVFSVGDVLVGLGIIAFMVSAAVGEYGPALRLSRALQPLASRPFARLTAAKLVSQVADWLALATLVGWVYDSTGSTAHVAGLMLVRLAPPIVGGGIAAMIVDRLPRSAVLLTSEGVRALAALAAVAGVAGDHKSIVYAALAASGAVSALSNAAASALVPTLVPAQELGSANAVLGTAKDAAMALGALGAGTALSAAGAVPALVAAAAIFAVAALLVAGTRSGEAAAGPAAARREGGSLGYLLRTRHVLFLVLSFSAATLATGLTNATLPRLFDGPFHLGAGAYGFGIAALAGGLVAGQAVVSLTGAGPRSALWIGVALVLMAGLFALLGLVDHGPTALLLLAAIGFVDGTTDPLYETVIQRQADPAYHGAVFGFSATLMSTTMMSAIAIAPLANRFADAQLVVVLAGGFLVLAGLIALAAARRTPAGAPAAAPAAT